MREEEAIDEATSLSSKLVYEVIRREGEEELSRPAKSLIYSGIAAGILISFSVIGEAILRTYLPDTPSRYLIENLGYSFGFLLVIMGRMQLFTENTITTILPLAAERSMSCLVAVVQLWVIVLVANVVGAAVAAAFIVFGGALAPEIVTTINDLSYHATGFPPLEGFMRAIPAGILVAAIVWMLPSQSGSELLLIVLFTWLIAAGDFTHIIAGSVEMWVLLLQGDLVLGQALFSFFLPVLTGNIVGGTLVFALLAWGQVKSEVEEEA
ncbi:formate/nitrite transporter family protein [Rhodobacteraceae bacterium N5(2021)]|uniref:Formate/nitrite transporter family protein n=1 Tax=Gymnodinialimonas phycosphaerae TaxID=2841589 RepID=A0A975TXL2_9RHOB|nr:formate/nitrite transporter family protein [Gymnodinialimonas phycosphaerae]MBY4892855.1 formate/nitrite transporter family protein [Gymnodinialimonas phycosphaerae]